MRLDLALMTEVAGRKVTGEAVGSVGENIEDSELPRIIMCRQQVQQIAIALPVCRFLHFIATIIFNESYGAKWSD